MEMTKDFSRWNEKQRQLDAKQERLYFRASEVWWVHLGENIGVEANGKSSQYLRPAIILKKFNKCSFLSIPLTTSPIRNNYRISIGKILDKEAAANVSQLRYMDSKRLAKKICTMDSILFSDIKKKAGEINFR
jgi:mRNA-degrading endonuclease toxin of MazEF toxin-antitoxin module